MWVGMELSWWLFWACEGNGKGKHKKNMLFGGPSLKYVNYYLMDIRARVLLVVIMSRLSV